MAKQGRKEEGIAQISQGLAATQALGADLSQPSFITFFAQACSEAGQPEEGLTALAEALDLMIRTRARCYEAELYRLKGELLLMQDASNALQAESCFQQAIEVARKQSAKSLELRAATSLAHLWRARGKHSEARHLLSRIYGWFTEGFDTIDLKYTKALIAELRA